MACLDTGMRDIEQRRAYLCRLTPDRALMSIDDAHAFLRERGLLTRTPDSALPSFFGACHEEPYAPRSRGFGSWPKTKYPWYFELARRPDVHELKVHRGKSILLTDETLALVDPLCRNELARREEDVLLRHLEAAGPSMLDDLQAELGLSARVLKALRAELERCGAVVSRELRIGLPDGHHRHTSELLRYDQAYPEAAASPGGVETLIAAAVRAAVLAPEREVQRWFSWSVGAEVIEELVSDGQIERPEPGWVAAPAPASP